MPQRVPASNAALWRALTQCMSAKPSSRAEEVKGFQSQRTKRLLLGLRFSLKPVVGTNGGAGSASVL